MELIVDRSCYGPDKDRLGVFLVIPQQAGDSAPVLDWEVTYGPASRGELAVRLDRRMTSSDRSADKAR